MKNRLSCLLLCAAVLLTAAMLGSCSLSKKSAVIVSEEEKERYAQDFMADLRDTILPHREHYDYLSELGVVISTDKGTIELDSLYSFAQNYKDKQESSLTILFSATSVVCARICYTGDVIYYYRYQYSDESPVEVTARVADSMKVVYDKETQKTELTLQYAKKDIATFTFREIQSQAADGS